MKENKCKHCGAINSHFSFQCGTIKKPIVSKPKVGDIIEITTPAQYGNPSYKSEVRITNIKPTPKPKTKKEQTLAELKKLAQIVVNKYVRWRDTLPDGTFKCISCQRYFSAKVMEAGHFLSVRHQSTRYHLMNLNGQCHECNCLEHGNPKLYRENLISLYSLKDVEDLEELARQPKHWTKAEILLIIEKHKL